MDVKNVIRSLNLNRLDESEKKEVEESVAGDMVDIEKVVAALANKRGNDYMDQIEDLEVIAKQDDGVVLQVTKMANGEAEKVGDFLTNAELDKVEVNNESNKSKVNEEDEKDKDDEEDGDIECPECGESDDVKETDDGYHCTECDIDFELNEEDEDDDEEEDEDDDEEDDEEGEDDEEEVKESVNENRVNRMMNFLDYVPAESLLDNVVRALSEKEAKETFEYILRMWGDNWALDLKQEIEDSRMKRLDILDRILNGGVPAEKVLEDIVRALSKREADEVFDYIARMMDIPENKEEGKSKAEKIIEQIKNKHDVKYPNSNQKKLIENLFSVLDEIEEEANNDDKFSAWLNENLEETVNELKEVKNKM